MWTVTKALLITATLCSCGAAPKGIDLTLPTSTTTTAQAAATTTSSGGATAPNPITTPSTLLGDYHYSHDTCGATQTVIQATTHRIVLSGGTFQVYDTLIYCNNASLLATEYRMSYTDTVITRAVTRVITRFGSSDCNKSPTILTNSQDEYLNYAVNGNTLDLIYANDCDGNGTHTHSVYVK